MNGMIVDGLGHVSLDSGSTGGTGVNQQQVCSLVQKKKNVLLKKQKIDVHFVFLSFLDILMIVLYCNLL